MVLNCFVAQSSRLVDASGSSTGWVHGPRRVGESLDVEVLQLGYFGQGVALGAGAQGDLKEQLLGAGAAQVLRGDVYESSSWIAQELLRACTISKSIAAAELAETASLSYMLPWAADHQRTTVDSLGDDWWPYGLEASECTLRAFWRYSHEQCLASDIREPRSLFAPERDARKLRDLTLKYIA